MYRIGIDLGGTNIAVGLVAENYKIVVKKTTPTLAKRESEAIVADMARLCREVCAEKNVDIKDIVNIGVAAPGIANHRNGCVEYSCNLPFRRFPLVKALADELGVEESRVKIANDANVAALGETKFGCGKNYKNTILITLGTGVGGGIVIDGKLFEGVRSAGAELGHSVIVAGGEPCTCGRKGCLEAYASATALIRDTKRAMEAHKDSKMWEIGSLEKVTGKVAFDYKDSDPYAREVVENYIAHLAFGITNFANIFRPQVILLGGGVCAQGDALVKPLQALLNRDIFAGELGPQVEIKIAELENSAGLLGAAALLMD